MQTPERLTEKIALMLGAELKSALLYGSAAANERTRAYSDFNVMLVVTRADAGTLRLLAGPVREWVADGNPAPIIMAESALRRSIDVFPIEFSDLRERHRVLHGRADWLTELVVRPEHLRHQLEFEIRSKLLHLRQGFLAVAGESAAELDVMARALSPVSALFRATLRFLGERVPASTPEAARALQSRVAIDAEAWEALWRMRQGERSARTESAALFPRLLAGLEALIQFVDAYPMREDR